VSDSPEILQHTVPRQWEFILMQPGFRTQTSSGKAAIVRNTGNEGKTWKMMMCGGNQPGNKWGGEERR
jgi:hypothetical protein